MIGHSYGYSGVSVEPDPRVVGTGAFIARRELITEFRVDEFHVGFVRSAGDGRHHTHRRRRRRLQGVGARLPSFTPLLLPPNKWKHSFESFLSIILHVIRPA